MDIESRFKERCMKSKGNEEATKKTSENGSESNYFLVVWYRDVTALTHDLNI
jgi:hypothetical protein